MRRVHSRAPIHFVLEKASCFGEGFSEKRFAPPTNSNNPLAGEPERENDRALVKIFMSAVSKFHLGRSGGSSATTTRIVLNDQYV
jgi:hypothetical protein